MLRLEFEVAVPNVLELQEAVAPLKATGLPAWGQMDANQMLHHVNAFIELYLGHRRVNAPTRWIGRLVGGMFLKSLTRKNPLGGTPRNLRTMSQLRMNEALDTAEFDRAKQQFHALIDEVSNWEAPQRTHPLYGAMDSATFTALICHHTAHHFHQFGLL